MSYEPNVIKLDAFPDNRYSITRPANVTQYTAGNALAAATGNLYLTFTGVGTSNGQTVIIDNVKVQSTASPTQKILVELWLFSVAPTGVADNAAFAVPTGEAFNNDLATIIPVTPTYESTTLTILEAPNLNRHIELASADKNLYGMVKVLNAYTPVSGETFEFQIKGYRVTD